MKKALGLLSVLAVVVAFWITPNQAAATGKGTLMGNAAGTKFCCASGTNDCSAAACKQVAEMQ